MPKDPDWYEFHLGTVIVDPGAKPARQIDVVSKVPWHDIANQLLQIDDTPSDRTFFFSPGGELV